MIFKSSIKFANILNVLISKINCLILVGAPLKFYYQITLTQYTLKVAFFFIILIFVHSKENSS